MLGEGVKQEKRHRTKFCGRSEPGPGLRPVDEGFAFVNGTALPARPPQLAPVAGRFSGSERPHFSS